MNPYCATETDRCPFFFQHTHAEPPRKGSYPDPVFESRGLEPLPEEPLAEETV